MLYDECDYIVGYCFLCHCGIGDECYDIFDLTILSLRSIFLGYFPFAHRELMGIVIYLLMLSSHLYRIKVILYDFLICDFMSLG